MIALVWEKRILYCKARRTRWFSSSEWFVNDTDWTNRLPVFKFYSEMIHEHSSERAKKCILPLRSQSKASGNSWENSGLSHFHLGEIEKVIFIFSKWGEKKKRSGRWLIVLISALLSWSLNASRVLLINKIYAWTRTVLVGQEMHLVNAKNDQCRGTWNLLKGNLHWLTEGVE